MTKLFKNYVFLFVFSGVLLTLGMLSLPPFKLPVVNSVLAVWLLVYLVFFLFKKLSQSYGVMFLILLSEFVVISLIAAGFILGQFKLIKTDGLCSILGLTLWVHSISALISGYYATYVGKPRCIPPYIFLIYIALTTLGVYTFADPYLSDTVVTWIASIFSLSVGVVSLIFAIVFAANGKKSLADSFA